MNTPGVDISKATQTDTSGTYPKSRLDFPDRSVSRIDAVEQACSLYNTGAGTGLDFVKRSQPVESHTRSDMVNRIGRTRMKQSRPAMGIISIKCVITRVFRTAVHLVRSGVSLKRVRESRVLSTLPVVNAPFNATVFLTGTFQDPWKTEMAHLCHRLPLSDVL